MSQEEVRRVDCKFTWKIEDYMARADSVRINEFILSTVFSVSDPLGEAEDALFQLQLFPKGQTGAPSHIGLYLQNKTTKKDVAVEYEFFIIDESGQKIHEKRTKTIVKALTEWGWIQFCAMSSVETNEDKVMVLGSVTFGCELKLLLPVIKAKVGPRLGEDLYKSLKDAVLTDLTLLCGERRFECHKLVLASRSSVFREMFENSDKDDRGEINIDQIEPHVMEKFLEFVYTNRVDLSEDFKELFIAADRFNVTGLKKAAEYKMMNTLDVDTVAEVLALFNAHGCETEGFEDKAVKYAAKNMSAIVRTEAWQKVIESHPRLVMKAFEEMAALKDSAR